MILSFFTFDRFLSDNLELLSSFLGKPQKVVYEMILPFIENDKPFKIKWQGCDIVFPRNVLINADSNKNFRRNTVELEELKCDGKIDVFAKRFFISPSKLTFMLTNKCVTNCVYCYADRSTHIAQSLSTNRILELITSANLLNVSEIDLIGGEIFLHKDWYIILSELLKNDFCPTILSTKIPLTEDIVKKIKSSGYNNNIQVSLDSSSIPVLQNSLNVSSDYLKKVIEGMYWLDENKVPFYVATILTKYNADEEQMIELSQLLAKFEYLKAWDIRVAINSLYIDEKLFASIKADREKLRKIYKFVKDQIEPNVKYNIRYSNELLERDFYKCKSGSSSFGVKCSALSSHMFVLPDGKVTICEQFYWDPRFIIGDLTTSSIEEVWNSPKAISLLKLKSGAIQDKSPCKRCDSLEQCYGSFLRCWADVQKAYGKNNWDYPDPRCESAPIMTTNIGY
jgi:radical SAM protein with 4Fe4S-binding SPASM domain